ncbi:MAG: hypothetical protein WBQ34_10440 [Candidatus Acidiferrales bacterium]
MRIANNPVRPSGVSAERSKPRDDRRISLSAGGVYRGTKRNCSERAGWRLVRGRPAQRLSVHYQLDCDFGTSTLAIYNEGDAVFLCENHVSAIEGPRDKSIAGVRPIDVVASASNDQCPARGEAEPQHEDIADVAPARAVHSANEDRPQVEEVQQEIAISPKLIADSPIDAAAAAEVLNPAHIGDETPAPQPVVEQLIASAASASLEAPAAPKPQREMPPSISRAPVRDVAYGNSAKALVDETIWNMATGDRIAYWSALQQGKGAPEAAQAAGGQLAIVHRKISDYTAKIEAIFSQSKARISFSDTIDRPLEQAILEIIGSNATDAAKDAAVDHLGSFQQRIKCGLERDISPLEAHIIACSIGDAANWGFASSLPEEVRPAYRAVYGNIRDAIRTAVPEARGLDERLANLFAAKSELAAMPACKALHALSV